jgi:hypothetical protein
MGRLVEGCRAYYLSSRRRRGCRTARWDVGEILMLSPRGSAASKPLGYGLRRRGVSGHRSNVRPGREVLDGTRPVSQVLVSLW